MVLTTFLVTTSCHLSRSTYPEPRWMAPVLQVVVHMSKQDVEGCSRMVSQISRLRDTLKSVGILLDSEIILESENFSERVVGSKDRHEIMNVLKTRKSVLHVVVVEDIVMDEDPEVDRAFGVHVRHGGAESVFLASGATDTTLVHEVGHVLGLDHVADKDNFMYPQGKLRPEDPTFTRLQKWQMLKAAFERVQGP